MIVSGIIVELLGSSKYVIRITDPILKKEINITAFTSNKVKKTKYSLYIGREITVDYLKEKSFIVFQPKKT